MKSDKERLTDLKVARHYTLQIVRNPGPFYQDVLLRLTLLKYDATIKFLEYKLKRRKP
jgi:hypothetical protein